MKRGKHALQGIVSNRNQSFLLVSVRMKYGKWQGTMESDSKIWDVI